MEECRLPHVPPPRLELSGSRGKTGLTAGDILKTVLEGAEGPVQVKKDTLVCPVGQMKEDDLICSIEKMKKDVLDHVLEDSSEVSS